MADSIKSIQNKLRPMSVSRQQIKDTITALNLSVDEMTEDDVLTVVNQIKSNSQKLTIMETNTAPTTESAIQLTKLVETPSLTIANKTDIVTALSTDLGFTVTTEDLTDIIQSIDDTVADEWEFRELALEAIKRKLLQRNTEYTQKMNQWQSDVLNVLTTKNQELADLNTQNNAFWNELVTQSQKKRADFKSTAKDRAAALFKDLGLQ